MHHSRSALEALNRCRRLPGRGTLDEIPDDVDDNDDEQRDDLVGSRSKSGARKKPIHPSRKQRERRTDTAPPRRWWEQPWLWFATIVVVVAASLGVSYAVNTDPEDITPVSDTAAFCSAVTTYRERAGELNIGLEMAGADLVRIRNEFTIVQNTAPPEIRATVDDLATRNLDATVNGMLELQGQPDSLDRVRRSEELLVSIDNHTRRSTDRYERYVSRACGINLSEPPPLTSTPPVTDGLQPVVSTTIDNSASTTVGG